MFSRYGLLQNFERSLFPAPMAPTTRKSPVRDTSACPSQDMHDSIGEALGAKAPTSFHGVHSYSARDQTWSPAHGFHFYSERPSAVDVLPHRTDGRRALRSSTRSSLISKTSPREGYPLPQFRPLAVKPVVRQRKLETEDIKPARVVKRFGLFYTWEDEKPLPMTPTPREVKLYESQTLQAEPRQMRAKVTSSPSAPALAHKALRNEERRLQALRATREPRATVIKAGSRETLPSSKAATQIKLPGRTKTKGVAHPKRPPEKPPLRQSPEPITVANSSSNALQRHDAKVVPTTRYLKSIPNEAREQDLDASQVLTQAIKVPPQPFTPKSKPNLQGRVSFDSVASSSQRESGEEPRVARFNASLPQTKTLDLKQTDIVFPDTSLESFSSIKSPYLVSTDSERPRPDTSPPRQDGSMQPSSGTQIEKVEQYLGFQDTYGDDELHGDLPLVAHTKFDGESDDWDNTWPADLVPVDMEEQISEAWDRDFSDQILPDSEEDDWSELNAWYTGLRMPFTIVEDLMRELLLDAQELVDPKNQHKARFYSLLDFHLRKMEIDFQDFLIATHEWRGILRRKATLAYFQNSPSQRLDQAYYLRREYLRMPFLQLGHDLDGLRDYSQCLLDYYAQLPKATTYNLDSARTLVKKCMSHGFAIEKIGLRLVRSIPDMRLSAKAQRRSILLERCFDAIFSGWIRLAMLSKDVLTGFYHLLQIERHHDSRRRLFDVVLKLKRLREPMAARKAGQFLSFYKLYARKLVSYPELAAICNLPHKHRKHLRLGPLLYSVPNRSGRKILEMQAASRKRAARTAESKLEKAAERKTPSQARQDLAGSIPSTGDCSNAAAEGATHERLLKGLPNITSPSKGTRDVLEILSLTPSSSSLVPDGSDRDKWKDGTPRTMLAPMEERYIRDDLLHRAGKSFSRAQDLDHESDD